MECLEGYIGIQGCGTTAPESGVYINSLPGISIEVAQKIADSEQITFLNAWNDITARAIRRFKTDVVNNLKKRFRLNIISKFLNTGRAYDEDTITLAADEWRGRNIEIIGDTPSQLHKMYIEEISIYFLDPGSTTLQIIDENSNVQYTTTVTAATAGWKRVYIGQTFDGKLFHLVYYCLNMDSVRTVNPATFDNNCDTYCTDICDDCDCRIRTTGFYYNGTTEDETENSYGLSVVFGLRCAYDAIICSNRAEFIESLQMVHGVEFLSERIYSNRVNRYTTIDLQKAKDLRTELDGIYQSSLQAVLDGIRIDDFDCCIECQWVTRYDQCTP